MFGELSKGVGMRWFEQIGRRLNAATIAGGYAVLVVVWSVSFFAPAGANVVVNAAIFGMMSGGLLYLLMWLRQRYLCADRQQEQGLQEQVQKCFDDQPFIGMGLISVASMSWLKCNDQICAMLGYAHNEIVGSSCLRFIHPDDHQLIAAKLETPINEDVSSALLELRFLHRAGKVFLTRSKIGLICKSEGIGDVLVISIQDVSAIRHAEEKADFNAHLLAMIGDVARIGSWSLNLQTMELFWSKEVCQIHEVAPEDIPRLDDAIGFYAPEIRPIIQSAVQLAMLQGTPFDLELPFVSAKGRHLWVRSQGTAVSENGVFSMLYGTFQDITARKQQQEVAHKLMLQQETLLRNTVVGIVHLNCRMVVSCNRRMEELFGYAPGEMIGRSTREVFLTEQDFAEIGAEAYAVLARGESYYAEQSFKRQDGSLCRGVFSGCAIDPARPMEGSTWSVVDVSKAYLARQEAHKMLQAVEQSPVSVIITDHQGLIEYVNPAFVSFTGYSREEVIGQTPRILKSGETSAEIYQALWATLQRGQSWRGVFHNRKKNGELFWESATISPIVSGSDAVTHYLAVKEDITERKLFIEQLEGYRADLEQTVSERTLELSEALEAALLADRVKDLFLANVSHELRTPLNVVIGLADLALVSVTDSKQRDYLEKITAAGKSLAGIINDLLDLSKIAAGHLEFEAKTFSLRQLLQRCRLSLLQKADEKGLSLVEWVDASVPDLLIGDPLRLEQILLNLLSNAIKFTPVGRVDVRICLREHQARQVLLAIEVEDTGIGISATDMAKLFHPFAQADASMTRKFGGTGLGLAICKRLVELMGGDIRVSSQEGRGALFRVTLCLGLPELATVLPQEAELHKQKYYRQVHVLVVDDQPTNLEIVEALLLAVGITPHTANNGQEAIAVLLAAGRDAFDLVLMDIQMPVMDGLAATREIRKSGVFSELPVIAMTAHTMAHEKKMSLDVGVNDHIGKPFETVDFYRVLEKWIPRIKQEEPLLDALPANVGDGFPKLQGVDTDLGLSRFVGNAVRYRQWLINFMVEVPNLLAQIRNDLVIGNSEAACKAAHAIKGRVGMLGMGDLHRLTAALEGALQRGEPVAAALEQMQCEIDVVCAEIHGVFGAESPFH